MRQQFCNFAIAEPTQGVCNLIVDCRKHNHEMKSKLKVSLLLDV